MTEIYVLIIEDRHSDVDVEVYRDELAAKRAFENFVRVQSVGARRPEDIEEYLTEDMIKSGWLANVIYSVEGDAARIEKQVLR